MSNDLCAWSAISTGAVLPSTWTKTSMNYCIYVIYASTMLPKELFTVLPECRDSIWMNHVRWQVRQAERTCIALFNLVRSIQSSAVSARMPTSSSDSKVSLELVQPSSLIQDAVQKTNCNTKRSLILHSFMFSNCSMIFNDKLLFDHSTLGSYISSFRSRRISVSLSVICALMSMTRC